QTVYRRNAVLDDFNGHHGGGRAWRAPPRRKRLYPAQAGIACSQCLRDLLASALANRQLRRCRTRPGEFRVHDVRRLRLLQRAHHQSRIYLADVGHPVRLRRATVDPRRSWRVRRTSDGIRLSQSCLPGRKRHVARTTRTRRRHPIMNPTPDSGTPRAPPDKASASRVLTGEFLRFLVMGGTNTVVAYGIYLLLLNWMRYEYAYAIGYGVGIVMAYVLSATFVFRQPLRKRSAMRFPLVYVAQFLISLVLLKVAI